MTSSRPSLQRNALGPLPLPAQTPPPDTPTPSFSGSIRPLGSPVRRMPILSSPSPRDLAAPIHPSLQAEISSSRELVNLDDRESSVTSSSDDGSNQNISAAEATNLEQKTEERDLYIVDDRKRNQRFGTMRKRIKKQFLKMGLYTGCYGILYFRKYNIFYSITYFAGV
jgi:hypothetical protein